MFRRIQQTSWVVRNKSLLRNLNSSVDYQEVRKFRSQALRWWELDGPAAPLHRLNPLRVSYIRACIERQLVERKVSNHEQQQQQPLEGIAIIDIGCGGGIVAEPLARLGARVMGIDMAHESVKVANAHMSKDIGLAQKGILSYRECAIEQLVSEGFTCDVVLALEVVEHVSNPRAFLSNCAELVANNGILILSTLSRTIVSYALAKVAAERILRWLPPDTHDWEKFLRPEEIKAVLESDTRMKSADVMGIHYDPIGRKFRLSRDPSANYMMMAMKG